MHASRTDRAAFARRLASRVLLVLGGTVAATAAAWAISSSSASAETVDAFDGVHGLQQFTTAVESAPVVEPVMQVVDTITADVLTPARPDEFKRAAEKVVGEFERKITDHFGPAPSLPVDHIGPIQLPIVDDVAKTATPVVPAMPVVSPIVIVAPADAVAHVVPAAADRTVPGGAERRGPPVSSPIGDLPVGPELPSPLTVPSHGSSGQTGNCGTDSPAFGMVSGASFADGLAAASVLRPVSAHVPSTTGDQPGVTPD